MTNGGPVPLFQHSNVIGFQLFASYALPLYILFIFSTLSSHVLFLFLLSFFLSLFLSLFLCFFVFCFFVFLFLCFFISLFLCFFVSLFLCFFVSLFHFDPSHFSYQFFLFYQTNRSLSISPAKMIFDKTDLATPLKSLPK